MPPDPPRHLAPSALARCIAAPKKCHVRCFRKYVRYFTKLSKTLLSDSVDKTKQLFIMFDAITARKGSWVIARKHDILALNAFWENHETVLLVCCGCDAETWSKMADRTLYYL